MLLCLMSPLHSSVAHTGRAQHCLRPALAGFGMPLCPLMGEAPRSCWGGAAVSEEPLAKAACQVEEAGWICVRPAGFLFLPSVSCRVRQVKDFPNW